MITPFGFGSEAAKIRQREAGLAGLLPRPSCSLVGLLQRVEHVGHRAHDAAPRDEHQGVPLQLLQGRGLIGLRNWHEHGSRSGLSPWVCGGGG